MKDISDDKSVSNSKLNSGISLQTADQSQSVHVQKQTLIFAGPLPPPEMLRQYDEIQPGFAERIILMTESENEHRRNLENNYAQAEIDRVIRRDLEAKRGQIFALIISLSAIFGGVYTATNGYPLSGGIISTGGMVGIISAFIAGRKQSNK